MKKTNEKSVIRSLLDLPMPEPEVSTVRVPRLGLEIVLRELPYGKLAALRGTEDANINYLLSSIQEPDPKDPPVVPGKNEVRPPRWMPSRSC